MSPGDVPCQVERCMRVEAERQREITPRSSTPARISNDLAEIAATETGVFVCQYIRFYISKRRFRFMFDPVVERLQNILFEVGCTRIHLHDRLPFFIGEIVVADPKNVHLYARGDESDNWVHVLRNLGGGVEGKGRPDLIDVLLGDVVSAKEVPGSIRAVNLETIRSAAERGPRPNIVKHGSGIKQFGV